MIAKLTGKIDTIGQGFLIMDVNGVGYLVQSSNRTLSRIGKVGDPASPLYIVEPRLTSEALRLEALQGLEPRVEGSSFRRLGRRARFAVHNPTAEPIRSELRFHGYRRYGPDDSPERYAAGVRATDRHIGTLLAALEERGLDDNTVVVFLSDHGEMLGEHEAWGHVDHLWRQTLHIPLIIKAPGLTNAHPLGELAGGGAVHDGEMGRFHLRHGQGIGN